MGDIEKKRDRERGGEAETKQRVRETDSTHKIHLCVKCVLIAHTHYTFV